MTDEEDEEDDMDVVDFDPELDWNVNFDASFFAMLAPTNFGSSSSVLSSTSIVLSFSTRFPLPFDDEDVVGRAVDRVFVRMDVDVRGIRRDLATGTGAAAESTSTTAGVLGLARLFPLALRAFARGISSISSDDPLSG